MRFAALWLCLCITGLAAPDGSNKQGNNQGNKQDSAEWSSLDHAAQTLSYASTALPPGPLPTVNLDDISPPPRSLLGEMVSAVPPTVLVDLMIPTRRASLASEFQAGNTPAWYSNLPGDVKSYFKEVRSEIKEGALATPTGSAAAPGTASATPSATASGAAASSTASGAAARDTGGLAAGAAGALGVLGVAFAL